MAFHVPELSRLINHPVLGSTSGAGNNGCFILESPEPGWSLVLVASDGEGWEHVSVHARGRKMNAMRTPTWKEMCYVKRLCWDGEDEVVQFHPKESQYVNYHPHVLHLWRPIGIGIVVPPAHLVGPSKV
jgi:hypothetical protein